MSNRSECGHHWASDWAKVGAIFCALTLCGFGSALAQLPANSIGAACANSSQSIASGAFGIIRCDSTGALPVTGTFSATLGGFAPTPAYATLSATTSNATVALPSGTVVVVYNNGTTATAVKLGTSGTVASMTAGDIIQPGSWEAFTVGSNTQLAAITASGTNTLVLSGGAGLATGAGGGSSSGGGSSAITTWAGGTLGAMANYGTSPGAVLVPGMNSFVTNTVAVTGAFFQATQPISAASLPLPTLAATSTKQSDGSQKTQIVDGSGAVIASTSNALNVQCANCSGSGVSTADAASFTAGASLFAGGGGFFQTTATSNALTTGQQGMFQVTANRAIFSNLRNASGTEIGTVGTPIQTNDAAVLAAINANGASAISTGDNTIGRVKITDGTNVGAVKAASTAALATDPAQVVAISPNNNVAVTGTFFQATQPVSATSLPLPSLASTSTKQSDGTQKTQIVDGSGAVIASTSNSLNVQCANCSGSGASAADEASFTAGSSVFAPSGGFFQTTATTAPLTTGQQGLVQMTATRAFFTNLRNAAGTEIGTSTTPVQVSLANTAANATAVKVDGSAVTQPVSGTVTTTPPSNASTNVAQVAGTTTDTNSGTKSAGTLRVVLATDQPQLTNKLLVTPDSVALPANQSVNVSQINAVTPLMGNGTTGTGSQRVTIASDNSAVIGMGVGATGAAVPANAVLVGVSNGGNTTAMVGDQCQTNAHTTTPISINAASTTVVVAGTSAKKTYICGMMLFSAGTTNVGIVQGSGSTCGTSTLGLIGGATAATGPNLTAQTGFVIPTSGYASAATTVNANDICLINSLAIQVSGFIVTAVQ